MVIVESVKSGVWVCETPSETGGQGAIVIRVEIVDVDDGIEKS